MQYSSDRSLPLHWLSRRTSNLDVLLRRYGDGGDGIASLIKEMRPGDEIRKFNSPKRTRTSRSVWSGYALVRDGKPIRWVVRLCLE